MEVTGVEVSNSGELGAGIFSFLSFIVLTIIILAICFVLIWLLLRFYKKILLRQKISSYINNEGIAYFHIKIPQTNEKKEDAIESFLNSLHRLLPQGTHLSLEMGSANQFLSFFIVIPSEYKQVLESQLYAQFADAEIQEVEDYLKHLDHAAIEEFDFKRSSIYPISTYKSLKDDLLKEMSAYLSKLKGGDKVFLQLALKRVGGKVWERDFKVWSSGKSKKEIKENLPGLFEDKLSKDLYLGKLRLIYISGDHISAQRKLSTFMGLFKILKSEDNELKRKSKLFSKNLLKEVKARVFEDGDFYSTSEIATIYHFPYKGNTISNVVQTTSKRSPAPDILPFEGTTDSKEVTIFGETTYRSDHRKFGIKRIDRRRHMYVIGKTGSGKSRLLELLLIADIQAGKGCCLLDPHGDLADEIMKFVPEDRIKDVVYINPSDTDFPIGFNPLEPTQDYQAKQQLSTFFISIFKKLFEASWNPRMELLIRYITLALLDTPDSSVLGIPRILSDTAFRQRVIMQIKDPVVKGFWTNEFSTSSDQLSREAIVPIMNKVSQFIANPIVRNMVGQRKNSLNFRQFMDEGKIVIINNSKGKLGDENSALLGSMMITKIQQAALSRANISEEERRDFYFYIDEFQNFATDAFSSILSEARKYHLNLTIAHQYMAQLPNEVRATTFGNVGTIISFAIGGDDANYLSKEFAPIFSSDDLINLNNREMYIKMSIDGKLTPPFSAKTVTVPSSPFDFSEKILSHSRLTYGKTRVAVENEIKQWTESTESVAGSSDSDKFPEPII